jgi:hypothetical protein
MGQQHKQMKMCESVLLGHIWGEMKETELHKYFNIEALHQGSDFLWGRCLLAEYIFQHHTFRFNGTVTTFLIGLILILLLALFLANWTDNLVLLCTTSSYRNIQRLVVGTKMQRASYSTPDRRPHVLKPARNALNTAQGSPRVGLSIALKKAVQASAIKAEKKTARWVSKLRHIWSLPILLPVISKKMGSLIPRLTHRHGTTTLWMLTRTASL